MPTYEYRCKECGDQLEVVQSFVDDALTECPACGGVLRKVFGNIGVSFKGSGFYKTDSRNGSSKKSETAKDKDGARTSDSSSSTDKKDSGSGSKDNDKSSSESTTTKATPSTPTPSTKSSEAKSA